MKLHDANTVPFEHYIFDDFADPALLRRVSAEFDQVPADAWFSYSDEHQRGKRVCFRPEAMPPALRQFVQDFTQGLAGEISRWTSQELVGDPSLWGAGLHVTPPGGELLPHVDGELHPHTGLMRRANAIVYCTPGWVRDEGGELELHGARGVVRIVPRFNRLVVFETATHNYHGHLPVTGTRNRKSIAAFFWSAARTGAKFLLTGGNANDERSGMRASR